MKKSIILFLSCCNFLLFGQNIEVKGVPKIENFAPVQYKNAGKIWDINSAKNGILYFAADQGLAEFDGKNWQIYKGSKGFTRSLLVANDSLIYTGSDVDFGVWKRDAYKKFKYQSLYPKKAKTAKEYEEFWGVYKNANTLFFVSHENIYSLKNNKLQLIPAPTKFYKSFESNHKLYFADEKNGLYTLENNQLKLIFSYPENINLQIIGLYQIQNKMFIVTQNKGLLIFENNKLSTLKNSLSEHLKNEQVFSFKVLDNAHLAIGTILNGLYITDIKGQIIHQINKKKGLINNTILSLHEDNLGNLWCGMDYGLSKIFMRDPITYFFDYTGNFGSATSAILWQNKFYLGTNQGLYVTDWENLNNSQPLNQFKLIAGSQGQVWSLKNIENEMLMGHDEGLFKISGENLQKLDDHRGAWTMKLFNNDNLLTGNYNGISVFKKINNNWKFQKKIEGIGGSCNQLVLQNTNTLWVNVPNYGIIKANLDAHLNTSNIKTFFSDFFNGNNLVLFLQGNKIHVKSDSREYIFNENLQKFTSKATALNTKNANELLNPFKLPILISKDYLFYPIDNGFALENINQKKGVQNYNPTVFRALEIFNNSETKTAILNQKIPYNFNNVRLVFTVPQAENTVYQYKFGNDKKWSLWTANNRFEFLNLREGHYDFYVRAKINDHINPEKKVSFTISPPFYRAWYAYVFYAFLLVLVYYLFRRQEKKILEKQKKALLKRQQKKLEKQSEKFQKEKIIAEQNQLEKEKLQLQKLVKDKTIELAIKAKEDEDKMRLLENVKEKIVDAQKNPAQNNLRLKEIKKLLDSYINVEDHTFEIQMDELHQSFFKNLQMAHPVLSIYDLRLCAYLRTGLNTQEIAEILNVLPSSLYVKRSRLRKKLELGPDEDLYAFLNKF